jgi:hypothetical protein
MLMTQIVSKFGDHRVHLVLQMELLLFQLDFLDVIMFREVLPAVQFPESSFVLFVFLDQTAKF